MVTYAVVTFTGEKQEEEETIAVVPVKQIDKPDDKITDIFWPSKNWPEKGSRLVHLKKAVQNCIEPNVYWPLLKGSVLHLYRQYDDAIRGLKKAEDDTSLETEADNIPRKIKPPRRFLDSDGDDEDEENKEPSKKKGFQKRQVRKLSESDDDNGSTILSQVDSDILNAIKKNIHVPQVQDKERKKVSRKQSLENHARLTVL